MINNGADHIKQGDSNMDNVSSYGAIVRRANGIVDLVFWVWFPYNEGKNVCIGWDSPVGCAGHWVRFGNHVGDWEHVTIRFIHGYADEVYFSSHDSG